MWGRVFGICEQIYSSKGVRPKCNLLWQFPNILHVMSGMVILAILLLSYAHFKCSARKIGCIAIVRSLCIYLPYHKCQKLKTRQRNYGKQGYVSYSSFVFFETFTIFLCVFSFRAFLSLKMNFNFGRFDWTGGSSPAPSLVTGWPPLKIGYFGCFG